MDIQPNLDPSSDPFSFFQIPKPQSQDIIEQYIDCFFEPTLHVNQWFRDHPFFDVFRQLYLNYAFIHATSADVERLWSTASFINDRRRCRTSPDTLRRSLFIHKNYPISNRGMTCHRSHPSTFSQLKTTPIQVLPVLHITIDDVNEQINEVDESESDNADNESVELPQIDTFWTKSSSSLNFNQSVQILMLDSSIKRKRGTQIMTEEPEPQTKKRRTLKGKKSKLCSPTSLGNLQLLNHQPLLGLYQQIYFIYFFVLIFLAEEYWIKFDGDCTCFSTNCSCQIWYLGITISEKNSGFDVSFHDGDLEFVQWNHSCSHWAVEPSEN